MKRSLAAAAAVTLVATAAVALASPSAAHAAVQAVPDPAGLAVAAADGVVAGNNPALFKGPGDEITRSKVERGTNGLHYVSYERSYHGLSVIGGDLMLL